MIVTLTSTCQFSTKVSKIAMIADENCALINIKKVKLYLWYISGNSTTKVSSFNNSNRFQSKTIDPPKVLIVWILIFELANSILVYSVSDLYKHVSFFFFLNVYWRGNGTKDLRFNSKDNQIVYGWKTFAFRTFVESVYLCSQ